MILTISGKGGSGKSTCAKLLCKELGYKRLYAGQKFRDNAKELGMDLLSYLQHLEDFPEEEKKIDEFFKNKSRELGNVVYEGRVAKFIVPESVGIFLDVCIDEGVRRIMGDLVDNSEARNEIGFDDKDQARNTYIQRIDEDRERYDALYNCNIYDLNMYDIVIDTSNITAKQVVEKILDKLSTYSDT